jgi:hypothetical protein
MNENNISGIGSFHVITRVGSVPSLEHKWDPGIFIDSNESACLLHGLNSGMGHFWNGSKPEGCNRRRLFFTFPYTSSVLYIAGDHKDGIIGQ